VNVDIFSEGFDCPEVEFIQLARPTLSLSKYLQQVGRGMRISPGKEAVLILDNVGLYQGFGLPTDRRDWERMFLGTTAGKGVTDVERCIVNDGTKDSRTLMNLEMVRIKRRGEKHTGLEVFVQDGKYGVMRNGKVTCPARFRRIERLEQKSGFFALGIYVQYQKKTDRTVTVTTVIDRKGLDLGVRLLGQVKWQNGYFCGMTEGAYPQFVNCWDPVGNSYYRDMAPDFRMVGGVEIATASEHDSYLSVCKKLRYSTGKVSPRFDVWEMFFNRDIVIARDYLVVKRDRNHAYHICGYLGDSVLVQSDERLGYQQIFLDGKKGELFASAPQGMTRVLNAKVMGLERAKENS